MVYGGVRWCMVVRWYVVVYGGVLRCVEMCVDNSFAAASRFESESQKQAMISLHEPSVLSPSASPVPNTPKKRMLLLKGECVRSSHSVEFVARL